MPLGLSFFEDASLVEFMYLVFHAWELPQVGDSGLWLLCLCDIIQALINSLGCWFYKSLAGETQGSRWDQKIKRREVELDLQVSPEEIMSREVELGCESWTSFASSCSSTAVQQTLSLWLCPARQLKQQLRSALVAAQWQRDTALTLPLFWWQSTVCPVFFGQYPRSSLCSFHPLPPHHHP